LGKRIEDMAITEKLQRLADKIAQEQAERKKREFPRSFGVSGPDKVMIKVGRKYANIDVGESGRYMVELSTGDIYGIKGYGVIHRGHYYGNLDTIDDWYWGEYTAFKAFKKNPARGKYLYGTYAMKTGSGKHIRMATYVEEKRTGRKLYFGELIPMYLAYREAEFQFKKGER
jgi:hypothetical protein